MLISIEAAYSTNNSRVPFTSVRENFLVYRSIVVEVSTVSRSRGMMKLRHYAGKRLLDICDQCRCYQGFLRVENEWIWRRVYFNDDFIGKDKHQTSFRSGSSNSSNKQTDAHKSLNIRMLGVKDSRIQKLSESLTEERQTHIQIQNALESKNEALQSEIQALKTSLQEKDVNHLLQLERHDRQIKQKYSQLFQNQPYTYATSSSLQPPHHHYHYSLHHDRPLVRIQIHT